MGKEVSFEIQARTSLERSDFVGNPSGRHRPRKNVRAISDERTQPKPAHWSVAPRPASSSGNLLAPIGLGVVGGALGLFAGGVIGAGLAEEANCNSLGCALGYPILGGIVGETVGLSSGVYVGTRQRGSYLLTLLGGAFGTAVAAGLADATDSPAALVLGPVVQLGITIPIARSTRHKETALCYTEILYSVSTMV